MARKPKSNIAVNREAFDVDAMMVEMEAMGARAKADAERIESWIVALDPDYRKREAEESAAKAAAQVERGTLREKVRKGKATLVVTPGVREVLAQCRCDGWFLFLPPWVLPNYDDVAKVLIAAKFRWNRSAKAFLYAGFGTAENGLEALLAAGEARDDKRYFELFETPRAVIGRMFDAAPLPAGPVRVLEPSAGRGAIARAVKALNPEAHLALAEVNPEHFEALRPLGHLMAVDFLTIDPVMERYDRVYMNPPFSNAYAHVRHAFLFLKPGGMLVAVLPAGARDRQERASAEFRAWAGRYGRPFLPVPKGAFASSGTGVETCLAVLIRPSSAKPKPARGGKA